MKTSIPLLLMAGLFASISVRTQPPADHSGAEASYQAGVRLLQEGIAAEALPHLEAAVKVNKESYLYRLNAGRAAQFSGNFRSCVENLTEALRLRPQEQTEQVFYLWRGECNAELGDRVAAENDFKRAVELQPGLRFAYGTRIFYDTGNVCRGNSDSKYREALAFYDSNKIYEAYRELYVALKCNPNHLLSHALRLKIESADNNLATHAKFHRVELAKVEKAAANLPKPTQAARKDDSDPGSDEFLDKVFDVKTAASTDRTGKPGATPLLDKYFAQIDKIVIPRPMQPKRPAKPPGSPKPPVSLYGAASTGNINLALDLIDQGEDVNYQVTTDLGYKKSVLFEAVERKNLGVAKALLEAGANPNCDLSRKEMCPMAPAISQENPLAVALLVRYKVNVNGLYNSDPTTYAMAAAAHENEEILNILIEAGADRSARNNKGETAEQILSRKRTEAAAKVPPTADELRMHDLRMMPLRRKGISALNAKFNAHMEFYKKVNGGLLASDQIRNLRQGIAYLDEIIVSATELERSAARQLNHTGYDASQREILRTVAAEGVKSKQEALNLKRMLEEKISAVNKGYR